MDIRRFRALRESGVSIAEIARETGHDWKTVKKYLAVDAPASPPAAPPRAARNRGRSTRSPGWWTVGCAGTCGCGPV